MNKNDFAKDNNYTTKTEVKIINGIPIDIIYFYDGKSDKPVNIGFQNPRLTQDEELNEEIGDLLYAKFETMLLSEETVIPFMPITHNKEYKEYVESIDRRIDATLNKIKKFEDEYESIKNQIKASGIPFFINGVQQ